MLSARLRLASLWLSQAARNAADHGTHLLFVLVGIGAAATLDLAGRVVLLFALPVVLFAPAIGAVCNGLPRRQTLIAAAGACLLATTVLLQGGHLHGSLAVLGLAAAIYSPACYALLPAAARDAHVPLVRLNSSMELGAAAAAAAGLAFTLDAFAHPAHGFSAPLLPASKPRSLIDAVILLNALCALTALPAAFASDVPRPDGPVQALAGFFRDARRIWAEHDVRGSLLALALLRGLMLAVPALGLVAAVEEPALIKDILLMMAGAACGALLAGIQAHPTRMLGLVPLAASGLAIAFLIGALMFPERSDWLFLLIGIAAAMINVPLLAYYQAGVPEDARGNGMALMNGAAGLVTIASFGVFVYAQLLSPQGLLWLLAGLALPTALLAWRLLLRDAVEYLTEMLVWPFFRVYGHGSGLEAIPRRGPILVVANHSAWCDPMWLAKVLPRRLVPMLTSVFYDIPGLHALVSVADTIRVEASRYRKDAPELQEAVAALDRGAALLIFPEGQMRKAADIPLRPFGRGVWRILQQRPDTPVVVCWIEGGWGRFTSYFKGKPTKNKRPDLWRRIDVGVSAPQVLDPAVLADQRSTRKFLANECLQARQHLGLEPLAMPSLFGVHAHDEEDEGETEEQPTTG